jgi:hypothetical protein
MAPGVHSARGRHCLGECLTVGGPCRRRRQSGDRAEPTVVRVSREGTARTALNRAAGFRWSLAASLPDVAADSGPQSRNTARQRSRTSTRFRRPRRLPARATRARRGIPAIWSSSGPTPVIVARRFAAISRTATSRSRRDPRSPTSHFPVETPRLARGLIRKVVCRGRAAAFSAPERPAPRRRCGRSSGCPGTPARPRCPARVPCPTASCRRTAHAGRGGWRRGR